MNIPWERDLVERSFCQQLQNMGWQWLEGDTEAPEFTQHMIDKSINR